MASTEQAVSTLNSLIETCRDSQEGFKTAAEGVNNPELAEFFRAYSRQRAGFAGELQDEVRRLGGEPDTTGSVTASLHRGWMGLRAALTGGDEASILAECERGEEAAMSNYRAAFNVDLPANVRQMVERQFAEIKEAHNRIRNLDRASGAGA
ncbi:MAG TPA: PA2169 family four-helix-bundle protein [Pyrinomonadaceae bacterium]|jgi:uncharacterized protein (TIGR02284 family)|nr:PA2169 family four-helix-bundle protein [Pyrinomonadaceae bacterium]